MFKGNNRAVTVINNETHYVLHATSIVIQSNNHIKLNSGGYMTQTTKKVLNEVGKFLGFKVYQEKGKWFVDCKHGTLDFKDGMII